MITNGFIHDGYRYEPTSDNKIDIYKIADGINYEDDEWILTVSNKADALETIKNLNEFENLNKQ